MKSVTAFFIDIVKTIKLKCQSDRHKQYSRLFENKLKSSVKRVL